MTKIKKLNGTIKVGLGQSPSGKKLGETSWYNFYLSQKAIDQASALKRALKDSERTNRKMFYSHNGKKYIEININWIYQKIVNLQDLFDEEEKC